jgi:hypothetical protein
VTTRQRALALMAGSWLGLVIVQCGGCANTTPAQVQSDLTTALDLTDAACSVADTTGQSVVILACAITTSLENAADQIATLFVPVASSQVAAVQAKHPENAASKAAAALYAVGHPGARASR